MATKAKTLQVKDKEKDDKAAREKIKSALESRSDRAMAEFQEAIKLNPSFAAAHVVLGQMYLYDGRPEEAIA